MTKSKFVILLFGVVALTICSCSTSKHQSEETSFDRIDSLRAHFLTIEDSLLYRWNLMIKDDNERISDLNRLLDELGYAQAYDTASINSYKGELKKVKKTRYYMTNMPSDRIDYYDSISFAISGKIVSLAAEFEEFNRYPYMSDLVNSVSERESKILRFRVNYDNIAKEHNEFVDEHVDILDQIDPEYRHTHLSLFELPKEDL